MCSLHIYDPDHSHCFRRAVMDHARIAPQPGLARQLFLQLATAALLLSGCGGGGDAGTSTPAAASRSFAAGTITGFGSVIVNGVRFDDSKAKVSDDDGNAAASGALKLGMRVEIEGGAVNDDGTGARAEASEIRFGPELVGQVESV